jgi:membrane glycosyltransferase
MDKTMSPVPPEQPVAMPEQDLHRWSGTACLPSPTPSVVRARVFVFGLTATLTTAGTYGMYQVISPVNVTWLQLLFAALFALTFTWISFSCASAMIGFLRLWRNPAPALTLAPRNTMGRTAILMPIYNEVPEHVFSALETMARGLMWQDAQRLFDIFILSDTRTDDVAAREWECFGILRQRLGSAMGVYYRRRADNHHRKAGETSPSS